MILSAAHVSDSVKDMMKAVIRLFCLCLAMLCSCVNSSNPKIGICFTGQGVNITGVANDFIKRVTPVAEEYERIKKTDGTYG